MNGTAPAAVASGEIGLLDPKRDGGVVVPGDLDEEVKELLEDYRYSMFLISINNGEGGGRNSSRNSKSSSFLDEEDEDEDYVVPEDCKVEGSSSETDSGSSDEDDDDEGCAGEADVEDAIDPDEEEDIKSPGTSLRIPRSSLTRTELMYPPFWRLAFALKNSQSCDYDSDEDPDYVLPEDDEESDEEGTTDDDDEDGGEEDLGDLVDVEDLGGDEDLEYFEDGELEKLLAEKDVDLSTLTHDLSKMLEDMIIESGTESDLEGHYLCADDDCPDCDGSDDDNADDGLKAKNPYKSFLEKVLREVYDGTSSSSGEDSDFEPVQDGDDGQDGYSTGPSSSSSGSSDQDESSDDEDGEDQLTCS